MFPKLFNRRPLSASKKNRGSLTLRHVDIQVGLMAVLNLKFVSFLKATDTHRQHMQQRFRWFDHNQKAIARFMGTGNFFISHANGHTK